MPEPIWRKPVVSVRPTDSLAAAAGKMLDEGVGCVAVIDDQGGLIGILTERDLLPQIRTSVASPADTPVAYVTQTTLSVDDTRGIIAALHRRFTDIVGPETRDICYATQNRQTAVRELSKLVDVILVVGAKNSSNSNRLREIGNEAGIPCYLIADGSELQPDWFNGADTVGITAGASAPEVLVEDVIDGLRRLGPVEVSELTGRQETIEFRLPPELTDGLTAGRATAKV